MFDYALARDFYRGISGVSAFNWIWFVGTLCCDDRPIDAYSGLGAYGYTHISFGWTANSSDWNCGGVHRQDVYGGQEPAYILNRENDGTHRKSKRDSLMQLWGAQYYVQALMRSALPKISRSG